MEADLTNIDAPEAFSRERNRGGSRRVLRMRAYMVLAIVDCAMLVLGTCFANAVRFGEVGYDQGWVLLGVLAPMFLVFAYSGRGYQATALADWRSGMGSILGSLYAALATVMFIAFCLKASTEMSRIMLMTALGAWTVLLVIGRAIAGQWTNALFGGIPMNRVLIADGMAINAPAGTTVIDARTARISPLIVEPVMLDRLARALQDADDVVVACATERRAAWAVALKSVDVHAEIIVPELEKLGAVSVTRFAGVPTVLVAAGPLRVRDRIAKRALDIVLASTALVIIAPLLIAVAVAIKLDTPGPVIFRQQRIGYKNRLFNVLKFRSMRVEDHDLSGMRSAERGDRRVTLVGRAIRATSIDELPQLMNILLGEMSFVGPRPHALGSLAGDQLFWEVDPRYLDRHMCKPGLTGLAQIRGFRGATHQRKDLVNRLAADLEYLNGWGVWRDVSIMLATVKVVVHRNAF